VWQPEAWGEIAEAPDLAAMYADAWQIDPETVRTTLERSYDGELSLD
jgi:hypothetical protein